jgi:hypothetical protein
MLASAFIGNGHVVDAGGAVFAIPAPVGRGART